MNLLMLAGYGGAFLLLLSYALVSHGKWKSRSLQFQLANFSGAFLLVVYSWSLQAYPTFILNSVWAVIGLLALLHIRRKRRKS